MDGSHPGSMWRLRPKSEGTIALPRSERVMQEANRGVGQGPRNSVHSPEPARVAQGSTCKCGPGSEGSMVLPSASGICAGNAQIETFKQVDTLKKGIPTTFPKI